MTYVQHSQIDSAERVFFNHIAAPNSTGNAGARVVRGHQLRNAVERSVANSTVILMMRPESYHFYVTARDASSRDVEYGTVTKSFVVGGALALLATLIAGVVYGAVAAHWARSVALATFFPGALALAIGFTLARIRLRGQGSR